MMNTGSTASITIEIDRILESLPSTHSRPSIFRIDSHLRNTECETVYGPEILSVGPYHHGIPRLQGMEQLKFRYAKQLLNRRNEKTVDRYVNAVKGLAKEVIKCYAEPVSVDENAFVRLMVLDGLFLIELFCCSRSKNLRDNNDPIFRHERILSQLRHDLLLLENQLPFFVLSQLFHMSKTDQDLEEDLVHLCLYFFNGMFLNLSVSQVVDRLPAKNYDHLCGLMHDAWCFPFAETVAKTGCAWDNIKSVTGLQEVGVKLRKATGNNFLMDIKFDNGVLKIPQLNVYDETELQFRNLITYEQYQPDRKQRYVSDYIFFMHCLINSSYDVELLRG